MLLDNVYRTKSTLVNILINTILIIAQKADIVNKTTLAHSIPLCYNYIKGVKK